MSELRRSLDEYLAVRRSVGYKLVLAGFMLRGFVAELEALGQEKVTTAAALAWATKPAQARPAWWAQRLQMVRSFAKFLHALDPAHEVPPAWLLTAKAPRLVRHAFTEAEVVTLMDAAEDLKPELRGAKPPMPPSSAFSHPVTEVTGADDGMLGLHLLATRERRCDGHQREPGRVVVMSMTW